MNRDRALEHELLMVAGEAVGQPSAAMNLDDFANRRCHPGPIRPGRDFRQEAAEELADCANYLRWKIQETYPGFVAGESVACREYDMAMRSLAGVVTAYHALFTPAV